MLPFVASRKSQLTGPLNYGVGVGINADDRCSPVVIIVTSVVVELVVS